MEPEKVLTSSFLDILFEGRNKEYGAYELRSHHNNRVLLGLFGVAVITGLLFLFAAIPPRHHLPAGRVMQISDVQLEAVQLEKKVVPPPEPKIEPPKIAEIKFTAPKIVKDEEVKTEDRPPEQDKLQDSRISTINQEGLKDSGIVGPTNTDGNGNGIVEAPKANDEGNSDRIFTKVEIESQYPGGAAAWYHFLLKNFRYPEDALNDNIQGTVLVQFIVDKEGNISDVEAIGGPDQGGLRNEAIRVIKKSGQWLPAIQNGMKVKSYKRQPVVFMMESAAQ